MSSSPHSTIIPSDSDINDAIPPPQVIITLPVVLPPSPVFPSKEISPKDTKTSKSITPVSSSSSVGSSSPVRSTTPPQDYPFDKSNFAKLDNSLWIISRPLGEEPVLEGSNELDAYQKVYLWK
ncbi:hypothetical protein Tco_0881874, partial [Tanacetum coccineum]